MIFGLSKTSIAGVLSFLIATLTTLIAFQVPSTLMTPGASKTLLIITTAANLIVGLLRVWVGLLQNDAPPLSNPPAQGGAK